jgi:hypothetical protein
MYKQRIYIDTSVIGGCFDKVFAEWSNRLFEEFIAGNKTAAISETTLKEIEYAPEKVKSKLAGLPIASIEIISISAEIIELADLYISSGVLTINSKEDALHIASATICDVEAIVSWNFKHIVNLNKIKRYNAVNLINGYKLIDIRTPREVIDYE